MENQNEIKEFDERFSSEVIELVAVTGEGGIGASKSANKKLWTTKINIIAWYDIKDKKITSEEIRLEWLVDKSVDAKPFELKGNSIIRIKACKGDGVLKLISIIDDSYEDETMQNLQSLLLKNRENILTNIDV